MPRAKRIKMTYAIAMAAGRDAANRRMHKFGRAAWNLADWKHAARIVTQLLAQS
jgi:hypothetical protein